MELIESKYKKLKLLKIKSRRNKTDNKYLVIIWAVVKFNLISNEYFELMIVNITLKLTQLICQIYKYSKFQLLIILLNF